jgi:hypothetical protein
MADKIEEIAPVGPPGDGRRMATGEPEPLLPPPPMKKKAPAANPSHDEPPKRRCAHESVMMLVKQMMNHLMSQLMRQLVNPLMDHRRQPRPPRDLDGLPRARVVRPSVMPA